MGEMTSFDEWYSNLHDICGHYDGVPRKGQREVSGAVRVRGYRQLDVADVSGNVSRIKRDRQGIRRDQSEYVFFIVQASGQMGVDHNGHQSILDCGDCVLLDSTKEGDLLLNEAGGRLLSVHLPRQVFLSNCDQTVLFGSRLGADHPMSAALRAQFAAQLDSKVDVAARRASTSLLFDMVRLAFSSTEDGFDAMRLSADDDRFDYAMQIINLNLKNEILSLEWLACQMGLSTRQLQRIFSNNETTFSRAVREKRLKFVAEQLQMTNYRGGIRISDLALSAGFSDISNFNRAFKDYFGRSPSGYRRARSPVA